MTEPAAPRTYWEMPDEAGPAPGIEFAPHGARLVAYLVDSVILIALAVALALVIGLVFLGERRSSDDGRTVEIAPAAVVGTFVLMIAILLLVVLYFPFFWARGGQTPGMRIFGLRVVR